MGFILKLPIDANTAKADAVSKVVKINAGMLSKIYVIIPDGVAGYAHFRLLINGYQIFPRDPGTWFTGNGISQEFEIFYEVMPGENNVKLEGYNEDDTHQHTIYVDVTVIKKEWAKPKAKELEILDNFIKLMERLFGVDTS